MQPRTHRMSLTQPREPASPRSSLGQLFACCCGEQWRCGGSIHVESCLRGTTAGQQAESRPGVSLWASSGQSRAALFLPFCSCDQEEPPENHRSSLYVGRAVRLDTMPPSPTLICLHRSNLVIWRGMPHPRLGQPKWAGCCFHIKSLSFCLPGGSVVKNPPDNEGDHLPCRRPGLIPGLGRAPGGGHGNPLQYSCLENPMDRGAWWATVGNSWTWLSD